MLTAGTRCVVPSRKLSSISWDLVLHPRYISRQWKQVNLKILSKHVSNVNFSEDKMQTIIHLHERPM